MRSVICVHESYDAHWPFTADHWHERWQKEGGCELYRTEDRGARVPNLVQNPQTVQRLVLLGISVESGDLKLFTTLKECYASETYFGGSNKGIEEAKAREVTIYYPRGDIQWGQTVAEYALGLTLCALRRIPHTSTAMIKGHETWEYIPKVGKPGQRGAQFGDTKGFVSGTLQGKRVRIVGIGNIGGRYAKWCTMMGAQVSVWDPFASDASFDIAGVTRCFFLSELVKDAEIFAPIVPLTKSTTGLITAEHINAIPDQSLVVQVTRAAVCDTEALYKRVLKDELFLAADVFDKEPVPLNSPLLGRHNVVHTPHNAGRTIDANRARADDAIARFKPR